MNITEITIEQELKQSNSFWVPAAEFTADPNRKYWIFVPGFPKGPIVKVKGARKPGSTVLQMWGRRWEVTHTWIGVGRPDCNPEKME